MSYSPGLASNFNDTKMRSARLSPQSGMCSLCTAECVGTCELGLSAVLGARAVYPTNTGDNQIAGEKDYPFDYSHFNINGRVFGAQGAEPNGDKATIFGVDLAQTMGGANPVKLAMPVVLPAIIKLNWPDYFSGAAMAGVPCVIGESSPSKDANVVFENGKLTAFPMLREMLDSFNRYDRGYGQIIVQCNCEDDLQGLPEIALKSGARAIEFKFGQSAKGTQPVIKLSGFEEAKAKSAAGVLVLPDPNDPDTAAAAADGLAPNFYSYSRLPMWDEEYLVARVDALREQGLENVYFKMAGYDKADLERVLRIAAACGATMVTFDGAGGGSGYSPCKMMNEWGLPTIVLEDEVVGIAKKLRAEGLALPAIAITGGIATEDQVFKALALGDGAVSVVGICRAAMAAANSAKLVGELIEKGQVPKHLAAYGTTKQELFGDLPDLRALYGHKADDFPAGAIGVFSYLNRIAFGLKHFAALNRKFKLELLDRSDLIPLTDEARRILGK